MNKIDTLHPLIREEVRQLVDYVNTTILTSNIKMIVTQTLRTNAEQRVLFLKRPKVTNADAGQSIHNYGLAFDFCLSDGKKAIWETNKDFDGDKKADWMEIVAFFKSKGFAWGGDFKSISDKPHFEKTFGNTWKTLMAKKRDINGYVIL
jgi:peptidoglycan L-alanyl-D-glutamate endopeptidase CwlK